MNIAVAVGKQIHYVFLDCRFTLALKCFSAGTGVIRTLLVLKEGLFTDLFIF